MRYFEIILKLAFLVAAIWIGVTKSFASPFFEIFLAISLVLGIVLIFNEKQSYGYGLSGREITMRRLEGILLIIFFCGLLFAKLSFFDFGKYRMYSNQDYHISFIYPKGWEVTPYRGVGVGLTVLKIDESNIVTADAVSIEYADNYESNLTPDPVPSRSTSIRLSNKNRHYLISYDNPPTQEKERIVNSIVLNN